MEVRKGYKMTEVGVVPEDWEVVHLGALMTFKNGANAPKGKYGRGIKFVNVLDILSTAPMTYDSIIGKVELSSSDELSYKIRYGDILFQRSSETIEDAAQSNVYADPDRTAAFGGFVIAGKKAGDFDSFYINYQLKSESSRSELISRCGGSTRYNIGQSGLSKVKIPLPPTLHEQNLIATALGDAGAWIRSLEALLAKKRRVKEGVMGEFLTPGAGWREVTLGEVASIIGGGTPTTANPDYWEGEINWFTPTEVGKTKYLYESRRKITQEGLVNSSAKMLPINTILLTSRAGIGDLGILKELACTNQGFQSLVAFDDTDVDFLYYWLGMNTNKLLEKASGSTFLEISPKAVAAIELSIPNYEEQVRIGEIISTLDAELDTLTTQLTKARALKAGMMEDLLTGRVRLV